MNKLLYSIGLAVFCIGGIALLAALLSLLCGLAAAVWAWASNKWRAVCKAESLIHEYRRERESYLAWKKRWISVTEKDKLPTDRCLAISVESDSYAEDYLIGWIQEDKKFKTGYICSSDGEVLENVTHWMPLPEPPEEGEQDETM